MKVFNLIDPSQSDCYNPFVYVHNEKDVLTLIDNLIKNTTPRNASSNDPFWEKAEIALDSALMLYLISEAPPEERNFETMLYMMNFAEVREDDDQYRSPLDMLSARWRKSSRTMLPLSSIRFLSRRRARRQNLF